MALAAGAFVYSTLPENYAPFGGGNTNSGAANELFFTAGPNDEADGLLGKLSAVSSEQRGSSE